MNLKVTGSTNKKLLTRRQQMAIQTEKGVTLLLLLKKIFVSLFLFFNSWDFIGVGFN